MKQEDLTLNHIKILKTVDECQSFSKAARKLGFSQSLISKKIKQLEDYFGTRLLTRSPGSIQLTEKGKKLIAKTHGVLDEIENLHREFQIAFDSTGEKITVGITPLLSEVWFERYEHRFNLCFPGKKIKQEITSNSSFSSLPESPSPDLLINTSSAYRKEDPCNRLQSHRMLLIDFSIKSENRTIETISVSKIDFNDVFLLKEIQQYLPKNSFINNNSFNRAAIFDSYQEVIQAAAEKQKLTILPEFCCIDLKNNYQITTTAIQDVGEYGIYIHVPQASELLILAEGLVRSFWLDQDSLEELPKPCLTAVGHTNTVGTLKLGIQRDSMGQLIASYGVKYIAEALQASSDYSRFKDVDIDRSFHLQVNLFSSGELMNRQMKRGELDICILDDIALLNNGSVFFDDLSFGSKLIGIASYNISGQDISIVLPKASSVTSVHELRGKRISTLFGSNSHRFIITLFDLCGIDINSDCTLIDEDPHTASVSLINGNIDAHVCCETFAALLEERKFSKQLHQAKDFNIRVPSLRGIVCRSQFIRENPTRVVAYLHDLAIANHWFLSNPVHAVQTLGQLVYLNGSQVLNFFSANFGSRIDPTLKPQWSWLLKTLNRRLEGKYGISKFDVDFWIDDYFLRLTYNLLGLDYHFQQISLASEMSNSYFIDEKFSKYMEFINEQSIPT